MYFLEQYKTLFLSQLASYQEAPEWVREAETTWIVEETDEVATPEATLDHARETTANLNSAVEQQEKLWLASRTPNLSFWTEIATWEMDTSWFNLDWVELSESAPARVWNWTLDEYSMWERVSSPEELALLWRLADGEIWFDDPDVTALAEELWMEELLRTAWIDGLEPWEVPEDIVESTPEMLEWSRDEVQAENDQIQQQIASMPVWSPERQALERRSSFLWEFLQAIESAINGEQPWQAAWWFSWFNWVDVVWDRNVIARWMAHRGIHEKSWNADKFLMGMAQSARETPWCAWYVSYVLKEAGYNITPTLSSRAFLWETGKWHVAFYAWNNQMLWWNQSNQVSLAPIRKEVRWWIMPEDLEAWREPNRWWTPEVGAIIVFARWSADTNMR